MDDFLATTAMKYPRLHAKVEREFGNNPSHDTSQRMTASYCMTGKTAAREITHNHSKLCTCHNSPTKANIDHINNKPGFYSPLDILLASSDCAGRVQGRVQIVPGLGVVTTVVTTITYNSICWCQAGFLSPVI
ncbi:hypothetical protein [Endozoicomonas sp. ONNA2]|uniref:hypothetical protein n=1 Tax=Endozoicomonas sp. ONNA2 TaxID=2828741 RepID=UPI0021481D3E|nr:hypothetical protein [Endozoicomonas sp. ONNA2]